MSRFNILSPHTFGGNKSYILFISTGNTCRAPMAYGVMKKLLAEGSIDELDIRTGGVMTVPGLMPTQECRQLLQKEGIDITTHRSCQLTPELIKRAALVLGMTSFHVQMALRMTDSARGKTFLLKEFAGFDGKNDQVQDPMGCTLEVYKKVFRDIRSACKRLMKCDLVLACMPAQQIQQVQEIAETPVTRKKTPKSTDSKKKLANPGNEREKKASAEAQKTPRKESPVPRAAAPRGVTATSRGVTPAPRGSSAPQGKSGKAAAPAAKNGPAPVRTAKPQSVAAPIGRRAPAVAKSARKP